MIKKFFKNNKVHAKIVPFFDLCFLLRPVSFFVVWVMLCIGMYLTSFFPNSFLRESVLFITKIDIYTILFFIGITCLLGGISIINQISDKKSDAINKKLFLLNEVISEEKAKKIINILFGLSFLYFYL